MDIRLQDVRVERNGRDILTIPSLDLPSGRRLAILGPNGAGKTTLLRLIAGLERPDSGSVLVGGDVASTRRQYASFMFQQDVFLRRSLLENLTLALAIRGVTGPPAQERAFESLTVFGIASLADRRADRVSGGESRRASLARALALRAPMLLLDEPMAGLDSGTYTRLLDELPPLIVRSGATTLVVTHEREEAFRLCDDLLVLVDGHVRAFGSKHEVACNPRHRGVAEALDYTILRFDNKTIAVPPGSLQVGSGTPEWRAAVEAVTDLVYEWDVAALLQEVRVHVRIPRGATPPRAGDVIDLHTREAYPLS